MFEHLFIFCRLNEMEETRKPAKRARHSEDQEGTCMFVYVYARLLT